VAPGKAIRVCVTRPEKPGAQLRAAKDACRILRAAAQADRESFYAIHLDAQNRVLGVEEVAKGGIAHVEVHPREVFKSAILTNAAALLIGHNHPSGSPKPSEQDLEITRRLIGAGKLLGIPIRDHVIVGADSCTGLRDQGLVIGFEGVKRRRRRSR
jgi:DNA repair protein RadC